MQGAFLLLPLSMIIRFGQLYSLMLLVNVSSCQEQSNIRNQTKHQKSQPTQEYEIVAGKFSEQSILQLDTAIITPFTQKFPEFKVYRKALSRFYGNRSYKLAWFDQGGMVEQAWILYNRILSMEENGVAMDIHYASNYTQTMAGLQQDSLSWQELMITSQYLHFAEKTIIGLPGKMLEQNEWFIPRKKTGFADLLDQMVEDDPDEATRQQFFQYDYLKKELKRLATIEKQGGWKPIDKIKNTLRPGDSSYIVVQIRKRLQKEGYSLADTLNPVIDDTLKEVICDFQIRHGLIPDGSVGKATLTAMNVPVGTRLEQIIVNMERCRWLPRTSHDTYLMVNIPAFKVNVYEADSLLFSLNAIVGKETNKTAIFKGYLNQIVFSPYWNVPQSILTKEIMPILHRDPGYLERNHMEWHNGKLRQKPGPDNALGGVKFIFPNPFNIYLHDTPAKGLFEKEKRTFSHGCIRISEPARLAEHLLKTESG
ncbi:MAG: hypothetical protein RIR96_672, partial [Bacteroidota bacterium]